MKGILSILLSWFLIIGACKKENSYHTTVSGKVINLGSNAPIEGVMVVLQDGVVLSSNTSSDKKSTVYTDKNGNFRVELEGEHTPYLYPKKDKYSYQYIQGGAVIGLKPFSDGVFQNEVLEMKAEAYFEPWFKSKNDSYLTDTLRIEILEIINIA